jgi:serine/threonine-protein kinase
LRGDLDNIVLMAMRKEPARRYSSVGQFSEDIRRHLEGLPVIARKDTWNYRTGKFIKRNKIGIAASAVVALALIGGLAAALWQANAARRERDVANAERLKAMRINEFLQQMLSFSNQSVYSVAPVAQTKNVTVNQMLDEIAPRIEAELADQPEVRAQILRTIASAYASQGIYDKAEKNYRSALETQTRIFGTDHAETAATMTQFGVLALRQGKIAEADQLLENAVAFYRRQQARQAPDFRAVNLVTAMNFLGGLRFTSIDPQSGGAILEEALQIAENADLQGNERFALAAVQGDVGLYLTRAGELERADRLLRESLAIHRQLSEYPRWEMGATLASLGELYNRKNQPDQALEFLLESERIYRQTLGDKNRYLAFNLQHQAIALSLQKNFTAAEPKARQQLAIYLEVVPDNKLVAAIPKSVLGIVLVGNKRFDEAEDYLREGLQGLEQSPVKNHFINVQVTIALSQCLLNQNRLPEAEQFALAALAEARQNLGEQNPFVETAAESLARIHERQGKLK